MRRRRGRHDAGQQRRSRAAARVADPGGAHTWSRRRAGAGRCSSWSTRCRPGDRSPPQVGRRPGAAPARPARCWPAAPIARCSLGCGSWPRAHLVAAARRRRLRQQLAHQVQAWRSLTASSRTSTRCGAGAAGTMLVSGADRALQLGLRILAGVRIWSPRTSAACCSWITRCCTAFGWNVVSVLLESNKAKS